MTKTIIISKATIKDIKEELLKKNNMYYSDEEIILVWCNQYFIVKHNKNLHLTKENIVYINDFRYKKTYHVLIESDNLKRIL